MFVDRARIRVTGGAGGNGACSFRREKYVPRGGPDGGDGGEGGSIVFVAKEQLHSLLDIKAHSHWKGESGGHGEGGNRHGKNGRDIEVPLPPGTVIVDLKTGEATGDLVKQGQRFLAARGGRGGKGNARFATSTNRAPRFAELGEPGEEAEYQLELKLIAQVGLVGLPNAGKSTLLAAITAATPKIGDYPFTTLSPNLGVAYLSEYRSLTIADIPGIIEGAAEGKGLGHDFLRHVERTSVLLFLIDLGDENPEATLAVLESELEQYSPHFAERPRILALNKADITENRARFEKIKGSLPDACLISGATGEGVPGLLEQLWQLVEVEREGRSGLEAPEEETVYTYEAPFEIHKEGDGFRIDGPVVLRTARMTNFDNEEAVLHFQKRLQRLGVFKALKRMGAQEGQIIHIDSVELEYRAD